MSLAKSFKQNGTADFALIVAGAAVGCAVVLAIRTNRLEKQVTELNKVVSLNAAMTLSLTNAVGQMTGTRENPIT